MSNHEAIKEPTVSDLLCDIFRAKIYIIVGAALGLVAAFLFISVSVPHYKGSMIIAPASPMTGAESSSMLANDDLFALRFLAQRIGGGAASDFQRFENIYTGPSVASVLLKDGRIVQGLKNDRAYSFSSNVQNWNAEKLSDYMSKRVKLEPMGTTNAKRLVYFHQDGEFAEYFLSGLHRIADNIIRLNIREDAQARVEYLSNAVRETNNQEHARALTTLLMEQERLLMLVSIDQPYAAAVYEPASSSVKPEWPDTYFVYFGFAALGMFLGFLFFSLKRRDR